MYMLTRGLIFLFVVLKEDPIPHFLEVTLTLVVM